MFEFLGSKLAQIGGVAMFAILALLFAYKTGVSNTNDKWRRKAAQDAAEWSEKIRVSEAQAYERGLRAGQIERENEQRADEIARAAGQELGADDLCLSADIVERLRQLQ